MEQMWADGVLKTLVQPKQFTSFAKFVMGEAKSTGGRCSFRQLIKLICLLVELKRESVL
jgi:hypothetical protein